MRKDTFIRFISNCIDRTTRASLGLSRKDCLFIIDRYQFEKYTTNCLKQNSLIIEPFQSSHDGSHQCGLKIYLFIFWSGCFKINSSVLTIVYKVNRAKILLFCFLTNKILPFFDFFLVNVYRTVYFCWNINKLKAKKGLTNLLSRSNNFDFIFRLLLCSDVTGCRKKVRRPQVDVYLTHINS